MIKSKRNGVKANILTSQDVGGGGTKLLNDPVVHSTIQYITTNFGGNASEKVSIQEPGLYYVKAVFSMQNQDVKIDEENKAQFQLIAGGNQVAIANSKANSTMFALTLDGIAKINSGQEIHSYIHTSVAGVNFSIVFTTIKLRGDEDA